MLCFCQTDKNKEEPRTKPGGQKWAGFRSSVLHNLQGYFAFQLFVLKNFCFSEFICGNITSMGGKFLKLFHFFSPS